MKLSFSTMRLRHRLTHTALFLGIFLMVGCVPKSSTSGIFKVRPLEEMFGEYYKKIRTAEELTLKTEISSQIIISKRTPDQFVEYLKANLKILPVTDRRQRILNLEITPPGKIEGSSLEFRLDAPSPGRHEFKVNTEAVLKHEFVKVCDKIPFPLRDIPVDQVKYTKPSSMIDSDDEEIGRVASAIALGEDDLYMVVFKVSEWVRENVQGQIDSSTVSTSQTASWVLENRKGVCDEKSHLFIGLLRSLGIPAKFIIGFLGINYDGTINFKPHGWAEVYFPSAGWIPFDVAYNQLGFIDASHIKLSESADTSEPITSYEWKSIDISNLPSSSEAENGNSLVSIKDLKIRTKIIDMKGTASLLLEIEPGVWYQNIDTESYNVVEAKVKNPNKFYVITDIVLQTPKELEVMGKSSEMILMKPGAVKTLYWIVKPAIKIPEGRKATFPINILLSRNISSSTEFNIARAGVYPKYSLIKLEKEIIRKVKSALEENN